MNSQIVTLDAGIYEIQRFFSGRNTAGELIQERLLSDISNATNLTSHRAMRYNKTMDGRNAAKEAT